jgi:hypothetical protein
LGEQVYYTDIEKNVYVPIFVGSNYRNKENMYLYWFQDDTVLEGTTLSGNTFYMAAKFYNTIDGTNISFLNKPLPTSGIINEEEDVYFKVIIDRGDYSYVIYSGNTNWVLTHRVGGSSIGTPVRWYENGSIVQSTPIVTSTVTPTHTPSVTPTHMSTVTPTRTPSVTPTHTPSVTPSPPPIEIETIIYVWNDGTRAINNIEIDGITPDGFISIPAGSGMHISSTTQFGGYDLKITFSALPPNSESVTVSNDSTYYECSSLSTYKWFYNVPFLGNYIYINYDPHICI